MTTTDPKQWLLSGGGGFEGGEDGLRAVTFSGDGLLYMLEAYRDDCLDEISHLKKAASRATKHSAFIRGYICAVAEILRTHDEPTIAKDVLRAAGKVDWSQIDKADVEPLRAAGLVK